MNRSTIGRLPGLLILDASMPVAEAAQHLRDGDCGWACVHDGSRVLGTVDLNALAGHEGVRTLGEVLGRSKAPVLRWVA